jgi:hypothetical protein
VSVCLVCLCVYTQHHTHTGTPTTGVPARTTGKGGLGALMGRANLSIESISIEADVIMLPRELNHELNHEHGPGDARDAAQRTQPAKPAGTRRQSVSHTAVLGGSGHELVKVIIISVFFVFL